MAGCYLDLTHDIVQERLSKLQSKLDRIRNNLTDAQLQMVTDFEKLADVYLAAINKHPLDAKRQ
jgi:hypothetical protein